MKEIINTPNAPSPIGPYNQAVLVDKALYISGQVAINPETNELVLGSVEDETNQVLKNLEAILKAAGLDFSSIVKTTIFLTDMSLFPKVNEIYSTYFDNNFPARETVAVAGLPKGVNIEISAIAYKS